MYTAQTEDIYKSSSVEYGIVVLVRNNKTIYPKFVTRPIDLDLHLVENDPKSSYSTDPARVLFLDKTKVDNNPEKMYSYTVKDIHNVFKLVHLLNSKKLLVLNPTSNTSLTIENIVSWTVCNIETSRNYSLLPQDEIATLEEKSEVAENNKKIAELRAANKILNNTIKEKSKSFKSEKSMQIFS